jgi:hypothetical protein
MGKFTKFIQESVLATQEIDVAQFPNPITTSLKKIFTNKGKLDGDEFDDIVDTKDVSIETIKLKPSQDAVYLGKTLGMAIGGVEGGDLGAIISSDNYILDGHHRWAASMFNNPKALINGIQAGLSIGDLIPVLRALGDVFGNKRRGEPNGGDVNIFKASITDALACINNGVNMDPKFYNKEKAIEWLNKIGGEKNLKKSLELIQSTPPPHDALQRNEMPVIDADKREDKKTAELLNKGKIDIKHPYK